MTSGHPWQPRDGKPIACREKLRVLDENLAEIRSLCQDALDDAVALGCDPESARRVMADVISRLETTLRADEG